MSKQKEMSIPYEVAEGIVIASMQEHLKFLEKHLKKNNEGTIWLHPEDANKYRQHLIPAFKTLIKYYGG